MRGEKTPLDLHAAVLETTSCPGQWSRTLSLRSASGVNLGARTP